VYTYKGPALMVM